jgi:hypothetical protein
MKEMPKPDSFLRDMLIKGPAKLSNTKHIELDKYTAKQGIAVYNSRTGAPNEVGKKGYTTDLHVSPYVNEVITMTPSDFDTREEGNTIYDNDSAGTLATKTTEYLGDLNGRMERLEEKQVVEAITSGTVTVSNAAAGVDYTVDYGLDDDNKATLTGNDVWGGSSSDIRGNLQSWSLRLANKGYVSGSVLVDIKAGNLISADEEMRAVLNNRRIEMGSINPQVLQNQRASFLGTYNDVGINVDIFAYYGGYETADDTFQRYFDDHRCIILGGGVEIEQHYGKIENFKAKFKGKRFPNMWAEDNGKANYVGMESAPLAVLRNPNAIFSAKVGA